MSRIAGGGPFRPHTIRVSLDRIVIATGNPHKVSELRAILGKLSIQAVPLTELGAYDEPDETGDTFEANASIKALSYARATGLPCLADDSGLEIDALHGAPGVISSHYCTGGREVGMPRAERDELNNQRALRELEGVPPERRTARFVCVMALAGAREADLSGGADSSETSGAGLNPAAGPTLLATTRGTFEGRIGLPGAVPRGDDGFGYDPIFLVAPGFERTSAELPPEEKNRRSHRAAAALLMVKTLERLRRP